MIDHGDAIFELRDAVPVELCRHIIARFEAEPRIAPGIIHRPDGSAVVDLELKRSTDYAIGPADDPSWLAIDAELGGILQRALGRYVERYAWLGKLSTSFCGFQIQRTRAGEGFGWHADEDRRRRLALIFYLNDEFVGGGTEFRYQQLTIAPRAGSLLMFPPYWTHVHRGVPVESGTKYIVTTFLLHARVASDDAP